jgi:hypothetical protein
VAEASAFLAVWPEAREIRFGFVDPDRSVWSSARRFHHQLTAEQARVHESRFDIMSVAESIVSDDPTVASHLG